MFGSYKPSFQTRENGIKVGGKFSPTPKKKRSSLINELFFDDQPKKSGTNFSTDARNDSPVLLKLDNSVATTKGNSYLALHRDKQPVIPVITDNKRLLDDSDDMEEIEELVL